LQQEYDELNKKEQQAYQQWLLDKKNLFIAYSEISKLTNIKHPNETL